MPNYEIRGSGSVAVAGALPQVKLFDSIVTRKTFHINIKQQDKESRYIALTPGVLVKKYVDAIILVILWIISNSEYIQSQRMASLKHLINLHPLCEITVIDLLGHEYD